MKIAFSDVTAAGISLPIENDGWFPRKEIVLAAPVECSVVVNRIDDQSVRISGEMRYVTERICDRCCRNFEQKITLDFHYDCTVRKDEAMLSQETECKKAMAEKLFLEGPVVDMDVILREQALLGLPLKSICSRSCNGLCPGCGADLEKLTCYCNEKKKPSPFSVLKDLKGR